MKTISILIVLLVLCSSCKKDDFASDGIINPIGSETCSTAIYPNWETSVYVLPYPVGEAYSIGLSNCGGSFHAEGSPDQFAIDFNMAIGKEITAVYPGTVVYIEQSGIDYQFPNNLVVVDHGDGTFSQYMHLTQNGAAVALGDPVIKGSLIGYSGATGLAGYPHLHFVLTQGQNFDYPYISRPITFKNTTANPMSLLSGETYLALPY